MSTQIWILIGGVIAIIFANLLPTLISAAGSMKLPTATAKPTAAATVVSRRQVLDSLDEAYAYFESIKCESGMAAINTAVSHAFGQHVGEPKA